MFCYYQGLWLKMVFQGANECSESLGTWKVRCQQGGAYKVQEQLELHEAHVPRANISVKMTIIM